MKYLVLLVISLISLNTSIAQSWFQQSPSTLSDINNVNFASSTTGWAFGDSIIGITFQRGMIKKTTDKGASWSSQFIGSDSIQIISSHIFSANEVIAVGKFQTTGDGAVIKTVDGGSNWSRDTTSAPERLFDVSFSDASNGWIVGRNGYIGKSADGGTSWGTQTSTTGEDLFSISFSDPLNGWAVGADDGSGAMILHTSDGGATWTRQAISSFGDLNQIHALSVSSAVACGQEGNIIYTSDSGSTWLNGVSGTTSDLNHVHFSSLLNGRAVGLGGTVVSTTNGGLNWSAETSNTLNDISCVYNNSTNINAWYGGKNGDIYIYAASAPNSIIEHVATNINAYPNPVFDMLTIEVVDNQNIGSIQIYDITGNLIYAKDNVFNKSETLNLSGLSSGSYILKVRNEEGQIFVHSVLKQ